MFVLVTYKL